MENIPNNNRSVGGTAPPMCGCAGTQPIRSGFPQQGRPLNYAKFWQNLILNQHAKLHSRCFPSRTRRLIARGPVKGTALTNTILPRTAIMAYRFGREEGRVHPLYQQLTQHRDEIDKSFGSPLDWCAGTQLKYDYIRCTIPHAGIEDERSWREVQTEMISCMNRLNAAVGPLMTMPGVRR